MLGEAVMRRLKRHDVIMDDAQALSELGQPLPYWNVSKSAKLAGLHTT